MIRSLPAKTPDGDAMAQDRLEILISAVNADAATLPERMKIESDSVIVNQIISGESSEDCGLQSDVIKGGRAGYSAEKGNNPGEGSKEEHEYSGHRVRVLTRHEKGVGLSRNTALEASENEIIQFADSDIVYDEGYADKITTEFDSHPEADILLFNVKAQEGRETYWNTDYSKITWKNYGRYPAYAICARREKIIESGVRYSLLFGGGAPYMNGEDSLFLHDCLKAGLSVYRTDVSLGHELKGESTWFKGYTDKFYFDRGVLYHFLYGKLAFLWGFRFLFKDGRKMCADNSFTHCYHLLLKGVAQGRRV